MKNSNYIVRADISWGAIDQHMEETENLENMFLYCTCDQMQLS